MRRLAILSCCLVIGACGYRPDRFADRPPVTRVHDDRPIAAPEANPFLEGLYQADVYVRRELVNGLDPRRTPGASDVSSIDEVPRSSWYRPPRHLHRPLYDYRRDGPPEPPWELSDDAPSSGLPDAEVIVDARGLGYELLPDLPKRRRMRTAAFAIASRLMWALGYHAVESYVVRSHDGRRVTAIRWPVGRDLGPTPMERRREDDLNDHLPHEDRRTLRALPMFTAWLAMGQLPARVLRDVYVGRDGKGHVEHHVVGLEGALGVDDYLDAVAWARNTDREDSNFFLRVFSLGLSPKPMAEMPETTFVSVGFFDEHVLDHHYDPSPPFVPLDRQDPGDAYWAAKRLAALPVDSIAEALSAGDLEPGVQHWLYQVLNLRRAAIIARGFDQTTACEVVTLVAARGRAPAELVLSDLAIEQGFVRRAKLSYRARYLNADGEEVSQARLLRPKGSLVRVPLPRNATDYLVVEVLALRNGTPLSRAFEAHLKPGTRALRLLAVRH